MSETKNPHDQGEKIAAAIAIRTEHRQRMAKKRAQEIDAAGRYLPTITDETWDAILDRIANGEIDSHVMKSLGLEPSALGAKRRRDPAFKERYMEALEEQYVSLAQDIRMVTRNVPGYSTGDIQRDALVAKYDLALARTLAPRVMAERSTMTVEHTVAPVMLPPIALPPQDDDEDD